MGNPVKQFFFLVRILILAAIVFFLAYTFPDFVFLTQLTGNALVFFLPFLGIPAVLYQNFLVVDYPQMSRVFALSAECTGIVVASIFVLSVFITPEIPMRKRIVGLLFLPVLFFGNVLRIILDVWIGGHYSVQTTVFFHDTIGQLFIFCWAIASFYAWLKITGEFPSEKEAYAQFMHFLHNDNPKPE